MTHYDDEVLSSYSFDPALVEDAEEIARHLEGCEECRARIEALLVVDAAMRHPETWDGTAALLGGSGWVAQAVGLKARVDDEDERAEALLSRICADPIRFSNSNLLENPRAQNAGVVRYLCREAHLLHEKRPEFSLQLARTALAIAANLPYNASMSARLCTALAMRESANAFRYLGKFSDALTALKDAEVLFDENPATDPFDIAIVWFIRTTVLTELGRLEEARALAQRSAQVFHDYGARFRELGARLQEAHCLYFAGNNAAAVTAYEAVAARARAEDDRGILAAALNDAANAYLNLEQFEQAEQLYGEALELFVERGVATETARVEWSLAVVQVRRGELEEGAERLDAAREELRQLGLQNDHALATLDWAEARLALGEGSGVAEACEGIVVQFESEGMMKNARLALAYVQEALAHRTATPELVRQVRTYLEWLPTHPTAEFRLH